MTQTPFTIQTLQSSADFGKFAIEPLAKGFGHTLGNSLRRVLLSSVPGAAITSVKIDGVSHQFSTLQGVREDIVTIILSLKQVKVSYSGTESTKITLSAKGPAEVKASDFDCPTDVKISNPDLIIAHLMDKSSKLELEATVESGLGYSPAEDRKSTTLGLIAIDAVFTPVVRVNFTVEATRVGRVTNFDRLILEIFTDGTISAADALVDSAQTLVNYFSAIVNPVTISESSTSVAAAPSASKHPSVSITIEELDLPTRIANALQKAGFDTVGSLLSVPHAQLSKIKNLGAKSVKIVEAALAERGIELTQNS